MKKIWQPEELVEHWTLLPDELALLTNKNEQNRLGFALLLKFFQAYARFPENPQEIPSLVVKYVAKVINVPPEIYREYDWQGRSIKYHRAQIRKFFGFREAKVKDSKELTDWLAQQALVYELKFENLIDAAVSRLRELKIEPPTPDRLERITRSAIHLFEERFFSQISSQLCQTTKTEIDQLLQANKEDEITENHETIENHGEHLTFVNISSSKLTIEVSTTKL